MYLVFNSIDMDLFLQKLSGINYAWIYLSMFISIFEHILRGYRWNLLMRTSENNLSTYITTSIMIVSYFFALFIPRFNDFARCYLISKTNKINISTSLGTVVSERIFDLISLLLISAEISRREIRSNIRSETTVPSDVDIFILLVLEIK